MSGNDQPPATPENTGSEPADEPTPVEPAPVEEGFVMEPPPPGESAAPTSSKKNRLIIAVAAAVALVLIGGGFLIWALVGDDDDDDKDEAKVVSTEDFCAGMADVYAVDSSSSDPSAISDGLHDAGVTKELTDDQLAGRDAIIEIAETAKDAKDAEAKYGALAKETQTQADGFFTFVQTNCAEQIQAKLKETE